MYETNNLERDIRVLLEAHNVIGISGAPGIGKSEITYQVAKDLGLSLMEVRLYELGSSSAGLPLLKEEITTFSKPWWFKQAEEQRPDIIFFDDFHSVPREIQKFFYRLLTDRTIHNYKLPYNPKIILAGNFNIESAGAAIIESPVMGRFEVMLHYKPSIDVFLKWAYKQEDRFDTRVLAFLKINPDKLYTEDPPPTSKFPSPRNWEHLSKNISVTNSPDYAPGIVGTETGLIFQDFWDYLNRSLENIIHTKPSDLKEQVVFAVVLATEYQNRYKSPKDEKLILDYVTKNLPPDAMLLFARQVVQKVPVATIIERWRSKYPKLFKALLEISKKMQQYQ